MTTHPCQALSLELLVPRRFFMISCCICSKVKNQKFPKNPQMSLGSMSAQTLALSQAATVVQPDLNILSTARIQRHQKLQQKKYGSINQQVPKHQPAKQTMWSNVMRQS